MGAHNFSNTKMIKGTASDAYNELREEALYEDGHDAYNGTISTTHGFVTPRGDVPRYGTKAFDKWEDKVLDDSESYGIEKWGDCMCIEIKGAMLKKWKERRGLKGRKGYRAFYFFGWAAS